MALPRSLISLHGIITYNIRADVCRSMEDFEILQVLAETHLSTVALCTCSKSGLQVALKMYHKERMTPLNKKQANSYL